MRTITLNCNSVLEGIELLEGSTQLVIGLGESGRGRRFTAVPVPGNSRIQWIRHPGEYARLVFPNGATNWPVPVRETHNTTDGSRWEPVVEFRGWVLAAGQADSNDLLVRIPDQSGFRGSWSLETTGQVIRLAEGFSAQGDAGRMGGGPDVLLRVSPGAVITIRRSGRLYGKPAVGVWRWNGASLERRVEVVDPLGAGAPEWGRGEPKPMASQFALGGGDSIQTGTAEQCRAYFQAERERIARLISDWLAGESARKAEAERRAAEEAARKTAEEAAARAAAEEAARQREREVRAACQFAGITPAIFAAMSPKEQRLAVHRARLAGLLK